MADLPNNPISRKEQYLAKIAGAGGTIPDYPITREEQYLAKIAEGGSGGGGSGVFNVNFSLGGDGLVADKKHDEIVAAIDAGNIVRGHLIFGGTPLIFLAYSYDDDGIKFSCNKLNVDDTKSEDGTMYGYFILLKPDESTVAGNFKYTTTSWLYL